MLFTDLSFNGSIGATLVNATVDLSAMHDANSSMSSWLQRFRFFLVPFFLQTCPIGSIGATLANASFDPHAMRDANFSLIAGVFCILQQASYAVTCF
jgi:hypothetical protein